MITTVQVRAIMRKHNAHHIWTNKTKGHKGLARRVKCWATGDKVAMMSELRSVAGASNVYEGTDPAAYYGSIIVKCELA